jgi:uncharacterized protein
MVKATPASSEHACRSGARPQCAMAVMAKASIAGRTKTRLVPPLTEAEAASLNTAFLRDAAVNVLAARNFASISAFLAYAPKGSQAFFKAQMPDAVDLIETVAPSLGECLLLAVTSLLARGHRTVCLINSDSPTLPTAYLVAAAAVLAMPGDRIVLGPSVDGGYYLIGMKRAHAALFEDIAWSTEQVFAQTVARAAALKLPLVELPSWYDVDEAAALLVLVAELMDDRPFRRMHVPPAADATRRSITLLLEHAGLRRRLETVAREAR